MKSYMFRRIIVFIAILSLCASAFAQTTYLGIFISGKRIGYTASSNAEDTIGGQPVKKYMSKTVMNMGLLGSALTSIIDQTSWTDLKGRPTLMKYTMSSSGRSNKVEANFLDKEVRIAIDNNGALTTKTVPIPQDAPIVDDALNALLEQGAPAGKSVEFYVLDPTTATFIRNKATLVGPAKVEIDGQTFDSTKATIAEPRMTMTVFLSAKGDLLKAEAMGGIEMRPLSEEEALKDTGEGASADLAELTKIPVEPPLGLPAALSSAKYRFSGGDLSRAPIDLSQSIRRQGEDWLVFIKPIVANEKLSPSILEAGKQQAKWLKEGLNIPASDPGLTSYAKSIVGSEKNAVRAAKRLGANVHSTMIPNAGIGVLRDAREVFRSKEGVCRDYAILTASLLRSVKIPARLASGLVYADGAFYYHAWVESWDGKNWYGIDSTRKDLAVTPGHIKLAQGSVEDAFLFTFLDRVKVRLLEKTPKRTGSKV